MANMDKRMDCDLHGGFGLSPVTDAWTAVIENRLFEKYGHNPQL